MKKISVAKLMAYTLAQTTLDKGFKHNVTEISKRGLFLGFANSLNPYLSLQSRIILFKKLDLWQALYHNLEMVRVAAPWNWKEEVVCPANYLHLLLAISRDGIDEKVKVLMKDGKVSEKDLLNAERKVMRHLSIKESNVDDLVEITDVKKEKMEVMAKIWVLRGDLVWLEPFGLHGTNNKLGIFADKLNIKAIPSLETAYKTLIRLYLSVYGPCELEDIAQFFNVKKEEIETYIKGIKTETILIKEWKKELICSPEGAENIDAFTYAETRLMVNLLPVGDMYLRAYADNGRYGEEKIVDKIKTGKVFKKPVVLLNGNAVGSWDLGKEKIQITLAKKLSSNEKDRILHEARFLPGLFGQEADDWMIVIK